MNRYVSSVTDLQLTHDAFELARGNMEQLLSESRLSDVSEMGTSETNPDIEWETRVEPFYEPVTNQMWVRAVCSAGFTDTKGEFQNIELEHWITNLTAEQVKQIISQQQAESEYLDLLSDGEESMIQETTTAFLKEEGLDDEAYKRFSQQQRRKKLEYISEKGWEGYDEFLETLKEEENKFLEELGVDFDKYNEFAAKYVPTNKGHSDLYGGYDNVEGSDNLQDKGEDSASESKEYKFDWANIPQELWPIITQLTGQEPPAQ
jgi:hypothetical protein